ncbi:Delta_tubulin [Hexamita inflata]|uniref:Delta tubulin n=1 Tax=Hexamita inflata TaxID=28002 RepID=A0AA86U3S2_9EUKA|nr:Delta tubulin [Hexamita inflata]
MPVTLQFGQYGNQLAPSFLQHILQYSQAPPASDLTAYFRFQESVRKLIPRSVLIDMEPKVIEKCLVSKKLNYQHSQAIWRQSGAGNNWAHGYKNFGQSAGSDILDTIRKESEHVDRNLEYLTFSSLAGGTGSGLSSYVIQELDEQKMKITSQCILPFMQGEINVQCYNSILSFAKMLEHSSQIIPLANDDARIIYMKSNPTQSKTPNFEQMNSVIGHNLALNMFSQELDFNCNLFKIWNCRATPSVSKTESRKLFGIVNTVKQLLLTGSIVDSQMDYQISLKNTTQKYCTGQIQLFGSLIQNPKDIHGSELQKLQQELKDLKTVTVQPQLFKMQSCTIKQMKQQPLENCSSIALNGMLLKKEFETLKNDLVQKLARRQFLHFYEDRGVERDEIVDAIVVVEQMIKNYDEI